MINKETGEVLPRIKHQLNAVDFPKSYEVNKEPSKTVPGLAMTIQDMIARHRKGLPIDESRGALYQGDEFHPDFDRMDLIDRAAYIDSVADALVEVRTRVSAFAKTKAEKEMVDRIDAGVRERLAKLKDEALRTTVTDLKPE